MIRIESQLGLRDLRPVTIARPFCPVASGVSGHPEYFFRHTMSRVTRVAKEKHWFYQFELDQPNSSRPVGDQINTGVERDRLQRVDHLLREAQFTRGGGSRFSLR
jgi:hypothetical protein